MRDPRTPEILAWLDAMPLRKRLSAMHGMTIGFPALQKSEDWKARMGKVRDELKPTARQLGDIMREAGEIGGRLRREMG
jgi:hypothetical protein